MSPEQHFGGSVTAASDQFSFCVALYQSLYGYMPFPVNSLQALREAVAQGRIAPIHPRTAVPGQVSRAIRRGLAALPEQRFPSMSELLVELGRDSTARRRRIAVTAVVAAVVGAAGFVAAGSLAPASAQVCPDAQAELTRIWNPARANTVHSAFLATGLPHAEESWATIEPQLTRFAGAWGTMRNEACQTHAEGRQSDQLFDLRTVCLDQRRAGFAAIVDILTSTEATTLNRDIQAVGRLPSLAPCADTEALTAAMAPPEDAATRTRVNALRERLAQAQAEEHAGRYPLGLELVGKVLEEARTLGYEPLLAEALLRQGSLQAEAGADAAAEATLDLALASAVQSEHKQVAAQASSKRLWVRGHRLGRPLEALKEAPLVTAFNARIENDVDLYAEFLGNIGYVYFVGGNIPEAERSLRGALARLEAHGRGESALALEILNDLAFVAKDARVDYKEALTLSRRVTALSRTLLGEHHPAHLHHVATEVNILISVGRPNEARALLGPLERRLEMIADPRLKAYVLLLLGYIAREERDFDTARRYFGDVLELAPEHSEESVAATLDLGFVMAADGNVHNEAEIRAYFDDALARIRRQFGGEHLAYQAAQRYYGEALCVFGRPEAARKLFDAVAQRDESDAQSADRRIVRAGIQQHLGVAYHKLGDLESARRELTQALDVYEQLAIPGYMSTAELRRHLGEIAISEGRFDEALVLLRQSEGVYSANSESDYWPLALTRFDLARALTGPAPVVPEAARRLALAALAVLEAKGANFKPEFDIVAAWVREHVER